jgi:hypothetical protein
MSLKYCHRIQLSELRDTKLTAGSIYSCTPSRDALRVSKDMKVKRFHTSQVEEEEEKKTALTIKASFKNKTKMSCGHIFTLP